MVIYMFAFAFWILLVILAIINGLVRNNFYKPLIGDLRAHQISTLLFIVMLLFVSHLFVNFLGFEFTSVSLLLIGFGWLIATIIFEFIFGHYVFGNSWKKLFADYNLANGRLWILVLVFTVISPWIAWKFF